MRASVLLRLLGAALVALMVAVSPAHAAGWLPIHDLPVGHPGQAGGTAIGPDGTVTVTALDGDSLKVATKPPGQPFQPPVELAKVSGSNLSVSTQGDRAGNVVVVWKSTVNGTRVIRAASKPAGGAFTPAQGVSDTGSIAHLPRVAIAGGKIVLAWMQNERLRVATATAGGAFSVHDPLSGPVGFEQRPAVAVAPDGAAVIAWPTTSPGALHAVARAAGGDFKPLPDVASVPVTQIMNVEAAIGASGRATLAWVYYEGSDVVLQSASRGKTGSFGPVETIDRDGSNPYPALTMADDDTALVAWNGHGLHYALRPLGGAFGERADGLRFDHQRLDPGPGGVRIRRFRAAGVGQRRRLTPIGDERPDRGRRRRRAAGDGRGAASRRPTGHDPRRAAAWPPTSAATRSRRGGTATTPTLDRPPTVRQRIRTGILDVTPPVISASGVFGQPVIGRPLTMTRHHLRRALRRDRDLGLRRRHHRGGRDRDQDLHGGERLRRPRDGDRQRRQRRDPDAPADDRRASPAVVVSAAWRANSQTPNSRSCSGCSTARARAAPRSSPTRSSAACRPT